MNRLMISRKIVIAFPYSSFLFHSQKDEVEIFYIDANSFINTVFVWTAGLKDQTDAEYITVIFIRRAQAIINDNPCKILK
jgi:hypothetical protein